MGTKVKSQQWTADHGYECMELYFQSLHSIYSIQHSQFYSFCVYNHSATVLYYEPTCLNLVSSRQCTKRLLSAVHVLMLPVFWCRYRCLKQHPEISVTASVVTIVPYATDHRVVIVKMFSKFESFMPSTDKLLIVFMLWTCFKKLCNE